MKRYLTYLTIALLAAIALLNFHLFARGTVDDAFITWRYGKNLVDTGIWAFNPTNFDLTQAYTNPIYAALSILPAALGMDMVLFFKLVALLTLALPALLLCRPSTNKTRFALLYLLILALPTTIIHIFAGLETFLFVTLLAGLFVALLEARFTATVALTLILLFVRPEAWVLIALVPAYIFLTPAFAPQRTRAMIAAAILGSSFALYALFHYLHFGHVLPNTFYIKSGVPFNINVAIYFLAYTAPAFVLFLTPHRRLLIFILLLYFPMIISYSSATLMMNYAARFAFHIWGATALLAAYVIATPIAKQQLFGRSANFYGTLALLASTALIAIYSIHPQALMQTVTATAHVRNTHIALGKTLHQIADRYDIKTYALSDVGANPFHSGLIAYDSIGLGSSLVAHQKPNLKLIEQYNPDLAIISQREGKTYLEGEKLLETWLLKKHMRPLCDVTQWPGRSLKLYTKSEIPELREICETSTRLNSTDTETEFWQQMRVPPWHYWRE